MRKVSDKSIEEAMKTMTTEKLQQLYDDLGAGKITINQMRAEYGLPPLPGCDELLIIGEYDDCQKKGKKDENEDKKSN